MTDMTELLRRIDRLESRAAIGELVSSYGVACDAHDMPHLVSLFADDAEFASPSGLMQARGKPAIEAMFVKLFANRGPAFHWTHDRFVAFSDSDADLATGTVYSHAETTPDNVVSVAAMRYDDVYRRSGGRWRFAKRTINFLYYVPVTEFKNGLNSADRLYAAGGRRTADYPETLAAWADFDRIHGRRMPKG